MRKLLVTSVSMMALLAVAACNEKAEEAKTETKGAVEAVTEKAEEAKEATEEAVEEVTETATEAADETMEKSRRDG